jgi:hypothetical protein
MLTHVSLLHISNAPIANPSPPDPIHACYSPVVRHVVLLEKGTRMGFSPSYLTGYFPSVFSVSGEAVACESQFLEIPLLSSADLPDDPSVVKTASSGKTTDKAATHWLSISTMVPEWRSNVYRAVVSARW